jgi:hypothetical protein
MSESFPLPAEPEGVIVAIVSTVFRARSFR